MNKEIPNIVYIDRMQFIVATMTKNYDKARDIANTILKSEPDNTTLKNYLSILKTETNKRNRNHEDVDLTESDSELSSDSNSDNTSINSDGSTDSDNSYENEKERDFIGSKKFCQGFGPKDLVLDSAKVKTSHDSRYKYSTEIDKTKLRADEFKGKMMRVLPIRLSGKLSGTK